MFKPHGARVLSFWIPKAPLCSLSSCLSECTFSTMTHFMLWMLWSVWSICTVSHIHTCKQGSCQPVSSTITKSATAKRTSCCFFGFLVWTLKVMTLVAVQLGSSSVVVLIGSHSLCNSFVVNQFLFFTPNG